MSKNNLEISVYSTYRYRIDDNMKSRAYLEGGQPPPPLNSANITPNADCLAGKFEIWSVDSRENH